MSVPRLNLMVTKYEPALAVALVAVGIDGDLDGLENMSVSVLHQLIRRYSQRRTC